MTTDIKTPYTGFTYLDHQVDGIKWMIQREVEDAKWCRGGILGDDMGLGKTWQTIGLLVNSPVDFTLIVAPPVLIGQWCSALKQSKLNFSALIGGKWVGDMKAGVYVCSYGGVKSHNPMLAAKSFDRVILDEGQYIRNGKNTARFKSVMKVGGKRRWILSGTPVQNKVSDFKNLARWLQCDESLLKKKGLSELAANIIKRRSITLLKDKMPEAPTHVAHKLDFVCKTEGAKFKALVGAVEDAIERHVNAMLILEKYLRLQQFISHPQIYTEAMQRKFKVDYKGADWSHGATKVNKFKELIADASEPTLVFCNFKQEMDILGSLAMAAGYTVCFVRGGMSEKARTADIDETKKAAAEGKPTILFCQITAGNCGLNLQHLTRVIFYTQHWNPSVIDQALARSYRYGQTKPVTIHHIVLASAESLNIDGLMLQKHKEKRFAAMELLPSLEFAYHPDITVGDDEDSEA
jgi:SNF2 family DNA or RNA helicase